MLVDIRQAVEHGWLGVLVAELMAEGDGPLTIAQRLPVAAELGQIPADLVERLGQQWLGRPPRGQGQPQASPAMSKRVIVTSLVFQRPAGV